MRRPTSAIVLYALGLLAVLAVAVSPGGAETRPARWALVAVPVALLAGASLVVRRAERAPGN